MTTPIGLRTLSSILLFACFLGSSAVCAQTAKEVTACGVTFNLPAHLRITKPTRRVNDENVAECEFLVVAAKASKGGVCRAKDEGGSRPYNVCDWVVDGPTDRIVVAKTNLARDRKAVGAFFHRDAEWHTSAGGPVGGDITAEEVHFLGRKAYQLETSTPVWWRRMKIADYENDFAGTSGGTAILMQLSPAIAVSLEPPPTDSEASDDCTIFCRSLRPAKTNQPPN